MIKLEITAVIEVDEKSLAESDEEISDPIRTAFYVLWNQYNEKLISLNVEKANE